MNKEICLSYKQKLFSTIYPNSEHVKIFNEQVYTKKYNINAML